MTSLYIQPGKVVSKISWSVTSWVGFCGGVLLSGFRRGSQRAYSEWNMPLNTAETPVRRVEILNKIIDSSGTTGSIAFADRKTGVFGKYVFPHIPKDGKEWETDKYICTAQVSEVYKNRNHNSNVIHCTIITKTKPKVKKE